MRQLNECLPIVYGVIIGALVLNLWYLAGIAVEQKVLPKEYSVFLNIILVLLGAFLAFAFRRVEVSRDAKRKEVAALNRSLVIMYRQRETLKGLTNTFDQTKNSTSENRAFNTTAFQLPNYKFMSQDFESLDFLIEKEKANAYIDISISQESFDQAISAIEDRSHCLENEVFPMLASKKAPGSEAYTHELIEILGSALYIKTISLTDEMYRVLYKNKEKIESEIEKLFMTAKDLYPNKSFVYPADKPKPSR